MLEVGIKKKKILRIYLGKLIRKKKLKISQILSIFTSDLLPSQSQINLRYLFCLCTRKKSLQVCCQWDLTMTWKLLSSFF